MAGFKAGSSLVPDLIEDWATDTLEDLLLALLRGEEECFDVCCGSGEYRWSGRIVLRVATEVELDRLVWNLVTEAPLDFRSSFDDLAIEVELDCRASAGASSDETGTRSSVGATGLAPLT